MKDIGGCGRNTLIAADLDGNFRQRGQRRVELKHRPIVSTGFSAIEYKHSTGGRIDDGESTMEPVSAWLTEPRQGGLPKAHIPNVLPTSLTKAEATSIVAHENILRREIQNRASQNGGRIHREPAIRPWSPRPASPEIRR